jgi:very-short-patch-repair endonuclease
VTLGAEDPDGMLVIGRVDLVDVAAGIVIEAESWEFHGSKEAFARDLRRYTAMVRAGWRVLRFGWDEVMHEQETVRR